MKEWQELKRYINENTVYKNGHLVWTGRLIPCSKDLPRVTFRNVARNVRAMAVMLADRTLYGTDVRIRGVCGEKDCILPEHARRLSNSQKSDKPTACNS